MSLSVYATPLHLELSSSVILAVTLVFIHLLAIVCVVMLPFPMFWLIAMVLFLSVSLWLTLINALLICGSAITSLVWKNDNDWLVILRSGKVIHANLLTSSYVHPGMTVLNFRFKHQNKVMKSYR